MSGKPRWLSTLAQAEIPALEDEFEGLFDFVAACVVALIVVGIAIWINWRWRRPRRGGG